MLQRMEQMVPILTISDHRKLNNRESTLFAIQRDKIREPMSELGFDSFAHYPSSSSRPSSSSSSSTFSMPSASSTSSSHHSSPTSSSTHHPSSSTSSSSSSSTSSTSSSSQAAPKPGSPKVRIIDESEDMYLPAGLTNIDFELP